MVRIEVLGGFLGWVCLAAVAITGHECTDDEFACRDGTQCVDIRTFCDGKADCRDHSDEPRYWHKNNSDSNLTVCRGRGMFSYGDVSRCILPSELISEKFRLCSNDTSCGEDRFACLDGSQCITKTGFCSFNGQRDCRDGSDEPRRRNWSDVYQDENTYCRSVNQESMQAICILPPSLMEQKGKICRKNSTCYPGEFECADGSQCIRMDQFCDGITDCSDGSDKITSPFKSTIPGRLCVNPIQSPKMCLLLENSGICDGRSHCIDDVDECLCGDKKENYMDEKCYRCLTNDKFVLSISQLCDGIIHCPDLSDECLCSNKQKPEICSKIIIEVKPDGQVLQMLQCNASTSYLNEFMSLASICNGKYECVDGIDEQNCPISKEMKSSSEGSSITCYDGKNATACNGILECLGVYEEECKCNTTPAFCELSFLGDLFYVDPQAICNGIDEGYADLKDERGCLNRYYCTDKPLPNIAMEKFCDRKDDCPNKADEMNCTTHFYCNDNSTIQYLEEYSRCDGVLDCESGRDECLPECIESAFSDTKSMIKSKAILGFVWIFSLFAVLGCTAVVALTTWEFCNLKNQRGKGSKHTVVNKIMILNLSVSDFLVGVYTLIICIKALEDKDYCKIDYEWRSSAACSTLGAILVIGSEQSVFTMVLITINRLHAVFRPFSAPQTKVICFALGVCWLTSFLIGVIPLFLTVEDYFIERISFEGNKLFQFIDHNKLQSLESWFSLVTSSSNADIDKSATHWERTRQYLQVINPDLKAKFTFGYYSSHTVCLPTFFPDRIGNPSWAYSFALLLLNFIAFVFMLISYIILYKEATKQEKTIKSCVRGQRDEQNTRLQKKLTRILVSDFCCWMPVCIMGFLRVGGTYISRDAYLPTGLILIPINSALNPLLYSNLPEYIWNRMKSAMAGIGKSLQNFNETEHNTQTSTQEVSNMHDDNTSKVVNSTV